MAATDAIDVDVAVIGSGFSGSLMALALRRMGQRVALVERGRHPRFAIGESSTPLANLLIEQLADRYQLPGIRVFSKWGTWQRHRPDVAAGLKRGFAFFFHAPGEQFSDTGAHARQLMVAASPHDGVADTHWYRPDFDHALVREAEAAGAVYLDDARIEEVRTASAGSTIDATRGDRTLRITAGFVVDASGPRGSLHRLLGLDEMPLRSLPPTQALYAHFEGVQRWDRLMAIERVPPFPIDDAAVHHVFPGGWIWVLRFNNGRTSAGAALTDAAAAMVGASEGAPAWDRLLERLPSVAAQFRDARAVTPFVHAPRLAFRSAQVSGPGWALLPSAAGIIDPLLSTGFPLTLLGVTRLLDVLGATRPGPDRDRALLMYEARTQAEVEVTERLIAALYAAMDDPELFKRLTLLYFAAASYSEAAYRLGRADLAPGFLLESHPRFGADMRCCVDLAAAAPRGEARDALLARIDRTIEPVDTAGLSDRSRRDWYPVLANDLVANAAKLQASRGQIEALLLRSGFTAGSSDARSSGEGRDSAEF